MIDERAFVEWHVRGGRATVVCERTKVRVDARGPANHVAIGIRRGYRRRRESTVLIAADEAVMQLKCTAEQTGNIAAEWRGVSRDNRIADVAVSGRQEHAAANLIGSVLEERGIRERKATIRPNRAAVVRGAIGAERRIRGG